MTAVTITIQGDDGGPITAPLPSLPRRPAGGGLVLTHSPWPNSPGDPKTGYLRIGGERSRLATFAIMFAQIYPHVGPVVIWPDEADDEPTAFALLIGHILAERRPGAPRPPIVCAVRPPVGRKRTLIRHQIRADRPTGAETLTIWEMVVPPPKRPA
jgi:hypothetical protein